MDITYIPMARGFVYLCAVVDWFSRRFLSWRLSITLETAFCIDAVEEALARHGRPEIFNTDNRGPTVQTNRAISLAASWDCLESGNVAMRSSHEAEMIRDLGIVLDSSTVITIASSEQ